MVWLGRVLRLSWIARQSRILWLNWIVWQSRILWLNWIVRQSRVLRQSWIMWQSQVTQWNCAGRTRAASYAHGKVAVRCAEQVLDLSESQMNRLMPELRVVKPNGKCA